MAEGQKIPYQHFTILLIMEAMMKKVTLYCFLSVWFLSCGGGSQIVKSVSEMRTRVSKILILPIYLHKDFFIIRPASAKKTPFPDEFQKAVRNSISAKLPMMNQVVQDIVQNGPHKFEIKIGTSADLASAKVQVKPLEFSQSGKNYPSGYNTTYYLSSEHIKNLAGNHNVDAVFFQFIQVRNIVEIQGVGSRSTLTMPFDSIAYVPILYGADGQILYGGETTSPRAAGDRLVYLEFAKEVTYGKYQAIPEPLDTVLERTNDLSKFTFVDTTTRPGGTLYGLSPQHILSSNVP